MFDDSKEERKPKRKPVTDAPAGKSLAPSRRRQKRLKRQGKRRSSAQPIGTKAGPWPGLRTLA